MWRHIAQLAFSQLGFSNQSIGIDENRASVFPKTALRSITHSAQTALSVVM
ncbi:MAG: hypothetical protein JKX81_19225 [Arenicella sp.]|nr:hypothetical protein [Arenicella sp.]